MNGFVKDKVGIFELNRGKIADYSGGYSSMYEVPGMALFGGRV